ncbi:hypothetical protein IAT38_006547 [Cryptococcus sp. DSM 104549]
MSAPPIPFHTLRIHSSPLSTLHFSTTPLNTLLYAGDQDGWVSVLDLRVRRVVAFWKAHDGGCLGLGEWEGGLISHGRDNVIHFHEPLKTPYIPIPTSTTPSAKSKGQGPAVVRSLPTNALNFCRFSLVPLPGALPAGSEGGGGMKGKGKEREAVMAVPSLVDSELVDIYHVPSFRRLHASVNLPSTPAPSASYKDSIDPSGTRSGLVMSIHLFIPPPPTLPDDPTPRRAEGTILGLAIGYEDGRVELLSCPLESLGTQFDARVERGKGKDGRKVWEMLWRGKGHNEAIMAMAVDREGGRGWSVSADHKLVRYDFSQVWRGEVTKEDEGVMRPYATKQIGNSSIAVSADGKVVAVGGWDGKIRLFSAATSKPLGTLTSHRETVHALAFAHPSYFPTSHPANLTASSAASAYSASVSVDETTDAASTLELGADDDDDDSEEEDADGVPPRERWLASGGKDEKVALWGLMDFARGGMASER